MKFLFEVNPNVFNVFIVSASAGQKQFWAKFDIFGGSCTDPFYRRGPNLVCYSRPTTYGYLSNFVSIGLLSPSGGKKPQFLPYFRLLHSVVSPFGSNLRKLNTGAQLQTFPIHRYQNRFCTPTPSCEIGRTNSDVEKRDGQTDRQTNRQKNSTFLATPAAGEIRASPNLAW